MKLREKAAGQFAQIGAEEIDGSESDYQDDDHERPKRACASKSGNKKPGGLKINPKEVTVVHDIFAENLTTLLCMRNVYLVQKMLHL